MKFTGDRMMTKILSTLSAAGVRSLSIDRQMRAVNIEPRMSWLSRFMHDDEEMKIRVETRYFELMSNPAADPVLLGRTFSEALDFRTGRFFRETGAEVMRITPGTYEIEKIR